ncbi:DUF2130 domain-containing protein [soil metagenome]
MPTQSQIVCPSCGASINIEDVLAHDIEERIKRDYQERLSRDGDRIRKEATEATRQDLEARLVAQERAVADKDRQLKEAREKEISFLQLERELKEEREARDLLVQRSVLEAQHAAEEKIRASEAERHEMREREWQKKAEDQNKATEDLKRTIDEMKRRAEQGSQQFQGEVQEIAIEEYLRSAFRGDDVTEVRKGAHGADVIHVVHDGHRSNCGRIYYESKRTKSFEPRWVEKFKTDLRSAGADVGVIVTEAMPKDQPRFHQQQGVWICTFAEFKALAHILRDTLIRVSDAMAAQEHRGDKMAMLYAYLTSSEFRHHIEGIVEAFTSMREDLHRERTAMEKLWKQREKQIDKVVASTTALYGDVRGIAGREIASVPLLELPGSDTL